MPDTDNISKYLNLYQAHGVPFDDVEPDDLPNNMGITAQSPEADKNCIFLRQMPDTYPNPDSVPSPKYSTTAVSIRELLLRNIILDTLSPFLAVRGHRVPALTRRENAHIIIHLSDFIQLQYQHTHRLAPIQILQKPNTASACPRTWREKHTRCCNEGYACRKE